MSKRRIGHPEIVRQELWNRQVLVSHSHRKTAEDIGDMNLQGWGRPRARPYYEEQIALQRQDKVLTCTHPEDAVKRIIRGQERRLECGKCGRVLLKEELLTDNIYRAHIKERRRELTR